MCGGRFEAEGLARHHEAESTPERILRLPRSGKNDCRDVHGAALGSVGLGLIGCVVIGQRLPATLRECRSCHEGADSTWHKKQHALFCSSLHAGNHELTSWMCDDGHGSGHAREQRHSHIHDDPFCWSQQRPPHAASRYKDDLNQLLGEEQAESGRCCQLPAPPSRPICA
jgi:hypothetical protein